MPIRDTQESSPAILETRFRSKAGQASLNIELGIVGQKVVPSATASAGSAGGVVGGAGIVTEFTGGGGGGASTCFLGDTLFTLWGGEQIKYSELYALFEGEDEMPNSLSFDGDTPVAGNIELVTRDIAYEYAIATFSDGKTEVVKEHRYWTKDGYVSIKDLVGKYVMSEQNRPIKVKSLENIVVHEGVFVYNTFITEYQNYCADRKRVKNLKPVPTF
jgi:hypothetical protein